MRKYSRGKIVFIFSEKKKKKKKILDKVNKAIGSFYHSLAFRFATYWKAKLPVAMATWRWRQAVLGDGWHQKPPIYVTLAMLHSMRWEEH